MSDILDPHPGGIGERTERLVQAIAEAPSELEATIGLPGSVEPGRFAFTYMADAWGTGDVQAQDITFEWGGGRTASWTEDVSAHEGITPGSSSPTSGWASWIDGENLLLAYANEDSGFEGWARVPSAAPTRGPSDDDPDEVLADPARWVALARVITSVVHASPPDGTTGEQYD
jgi:hypothetical protein